MHIAELLAAAGYHVGSFRKAWGPGRIEAGGRDQRPAGSRYRSIGAFLDACPGGAPPPHVKPSSPHPGYRPFRSAP